MVAKSRNAIAYIAIQASSGKRYNPKLQLNGKNIPFIANKPEFSSPAKTTDNTSPTSSPNSLTRWIRPSDQKTETLPVQSGNLPSVELGPIHSGTANLMGKLLPRGQGYSLSQEIVWSSQISRSITPLPPKGE